MPIVSLAKQSLIDAALVRDRLHYDPETGGFVWKKSPARGIKAGCAAGYVMPKGYSMILINGRGYVAHRLAWLYVHGEWPDGQIDHVNGIRNDNRIDNLRVATSSQNQANKGTDKRNKSGVKGVYWHVKRKRWVASIRLNGKLHHIGYFKTIWSAASAYEDSATSMFGEFAQTIS